ncbi:MAG: AAA family ATPase [Candidatus Pacebacteria bacterium]|nr:AAA family ATPase [Candidatus Paceibacterota bacterium]
MKNSGRKPKNKTTYFFYLGGDCLITRITFPGSKKEASMTCLLDKPMPMCRKGSEICIFRTRQECPEDTQEILLRFGINHMQITKVDSSQDHRVIDETKSIVLDLFLGECYLPLTFTFCKDLSYVFLVQLQSHAMYDRPDTLQLDPEVQFLYYAYHVLVGEDGWSREEKIRAISDLVCYSEPAVMCLNVDEIYKDIADQLERPEYAIAGIMIIGRLMDKLPELSPKMSGYALCKRIHDNIIALVAQHGDLASIIGKVSDKKELLDKSKHIAYTGFTIVNYVAMQGEDEGAATCWERLAANSGEFNEIVTIYLNALIQHKKRLTENGYQCLEALITEAKLSVRAKAEYMRKLLMCSPNLIHFVQKLFVAINDPWMKLTELELDSAISGYTRNCIPSFEHISAFIDLIQKGVIRDSFKTMILKNSDFKAMIDESFSQQQAGRTQTSDITPLIEIHIKNCTELVQSLKEKVETLLQPLLSSEKTRLSDLMAKIGNKLDASILMNFLHERIKQRFKCIPKNEVIRELAKDVEELRGSTVTSEYIQLSLKYFKSMYKDYRDLIGFCDLLEVFSDEVYRRQCYKYIFATIRDDYMERENGNFEPLTLIGEKMREHKERTGVAGIFLEACEYFDNTKATAYEASRLVVTFLDTLKTFLTIAAPTAIPNTISAVAKFYEEIREESVVLEVAESIRCGDCDRWDGLITIFAVVRGRAGAGKEVEAVLKRFFDDVEDIKRARQLFKEFMGEVEILAAEERARLRKLYSDYYANYTTKTIRHMKSEMPEELSKLVAPLRSFYEYKKICSVRCLLAKELAGRVELSNFADRFDLALADAKKQLKYFLYSSDTLSMGTYEELFGECGNIADEMAKLERIMPQDGGKIAELSRMQVAYEEKKRVLSSIQDILRTREVVAIKGTELYQRLLDYEARIGKSPVKEAAALTEDVKKFVRSVFGESTYRMLEIFRALSQGKEMLLYLKGRKSEELNEMKNHIADYDDGILQRKTFDVLLALLGYITEAETKSDPKGFSESTVQFFATQGANVEPLLLNSKLFLNKLDAFSRSTHEKAILHMEEIDHMLLRSRFLFSCYDGVWALTISMGEKDSGQLSYEHLQELRERAIHSRNLGRIEAEKGAKKEELKKFDDFLELTNLLKNLMKTLKHIHELSHPELPASDSAVVEGGDLNGVRELLEKRTKMSEDWERIIVSAYSEYAVLTYFLPSQLCVLEAYFCNSYENQFAAKELLKFAGISVQQTVQSDYFKPTGLQERMLYLGKYIMSLVDSQPELPLPTSPVLAYAVQTSNITEGILEVYAKLRCPLPRPNQVLFCHNFTKWEQVLSFAYRASRNMHRLFTIVQVESLSYELQRRLVGIIQSGIETSNKVPLGFVVRTLDSFVLQHFGSTNTLKLLTKRQWQDDDVREKLAEHLKPDYDTVRIFISDLAGVGKTTYIQELAKRDKITLHSFSIYGELSLENIVERLEQFDRSQPWFNSGFFFKLFPVNNPALLDELFFQLLVMRCVQCGSRFVYLPTGCRIYLEIANTYNEELVRAFPYARYFTVGRVGALTIYDSIDPERLVYRHVLNYLRALEARTINETDLSISRLLPVTMEESVTLMTKYIFADSSPDKMPLVQVSIFLKFLSKMLQNYEKSRLFKLNREIIRKGASRQTIVEQLLTSCRRLTENSTHSKRRIETEQTDVPVEAASSNSSEDEENAEAYARHLERQIVPFRERQMMIVCFTETGKMIPLYDGLSNIPPEIQKLLRLVATSIEEEEDEDVPSHGEDISAVAKMDYKKMKHPDFVTFLRRTFNYPDMDPEDYVLTFDNFYKMIYIYLRAISGIPVILMGETGCGKTRMIKFLCAKIMHSPPTIMNIHMGVTREEIMGQVRAEAEKAVKESDRRHFIFFDEFNTNENLGLITEIICDRVLDGQPLPENLLFFAACNPYKKSTLNNVFDQVAGISKGRFMTSSNKRLVYKVYQLPKTILEYVWDFGPLKPSDEEAYIRAIISRDKSTKGADKLAKMLLVAHQFFREVDKQHVISLRDISRFLYLLRWFRNEGKKKDDRAAELAFLFCYYYRISSEDSRRDLLARVSNCRYGDSTGKRFLDAINEEAGCYTKDIELDRDIVWNNSLKECLFVMIVCVLTKTPLLAVGKPGCSKSLSLKILEEHFKGKRSRIPFFQKYPEVVLYTLQGSLQCDSTDVERIFAKAKKEAADPSLLPVVVIEEIGLCELSPRNPLKVLHKMLELENIELTPTGVGFIGLSNWRLDAAKMNRALYLSRLPPSTAELEQTAKEIYDKFTAGKGPDEPLMRTLAQAYAMYQEQFGLELTSDVFGLRDFYALVKQVSCGLKGCTDVQKKYEVVKASIKRNFSKVPSKSEKKFDSLWKIFCKKEEDVGLAEVAVPGKIALISESLDKIRDRHVLVTGDGHILPAMVQLFLRDAVAPMNVIVGSEYEKDQDSPEYVHMLLSRVIYSVEKGLPLMLSNLKGTHGHLYDLYNHNAADGSCRIMAGTHFHPVCRIHKEFRCLVAMGYEDFVREQPPLLNRLEKYYLSLDKLMTREETRLYRELSSWLKDIVELQEPEDSLSLPQLFANLDSREELVRVLILSQNRKGQCVLEIIRENCINQLIQLATADLLVRINGAKKNEPLRDQVIKRYKELHEHTLKEELGQSATKEAGQRLLYFTYSEKSELVKELQEELKTSVGVVSLGDIKSEAELSGEVQGFFSSPTQHLLILAVSFPQEVKHLEHLNATIMRYQEFGKDKNMCILVFMKRNQTAEDLKCRPLVYLDGYTMKMHDSLEQNMAIMLDQLRARIKDTVKAEMEQSFDSKFAGWLEEIFILLQAARPGAPYPLLEGPNGKVPIAKKVAEDPKLASIIRAKVADAISNISKSQEELRDRLRGPKSMCYLSIHQAARNIVHEEIKRCIYIVISTVERYSALASYFALEKRPEELAAEEKEAKETGQKVAKYHVSYDVKRLWKVGFDTLVFDWGTALGKGVSRQRFEELQYPFALKIYEDVEKEFLKGESSHCTHEDPVSLIREKYIYLGDQHVVLLNLMLEDFLLIIAKRHHIEVSREAVRLLLKLVLFDETSISAAFAECLRVLFKQQSFLCALLNLVGLCCDCPAKLETLLSTSLSACAATESVKHSADTNKFYSKMRERGSIIIGRLIEQLIPTQELLAFFLDKRLNYPAILTRLYVYAFGIAQSVREITNWNTLLFWLELSKYSLAKDREGSLLSQVSKKVTELGKGPTIMQSEGFISYAFDLSSENRKDETMAAYHRFKSAVYRIMLASGNTRYLGALMDEFNSEANGRYYMKALDDLCIRSRLNEQLEGQTGTQIRLVMNPVLKIVENYLAANGVSCPFGCVLFYCIWKRSATAKLAALIIKKPVMEKCMSEYIFNMEHAGFEYPNLLKLLSCLFLRWIADTLAASPDSATYQKAVNGICTATPVAATLRLYLLRKLKDKSGEHAAKMKATVSRCTYIETSKESSETVLVLPLDPDQLSYYRRLSQLVRHLKSVFLAHDSAALCAWINYITKEADKGYQFALPLCLCFLNELYTLHMGKKTGTQIETAVSRFLQEGRLREAITGSLGANMCEFLTSLTMNFAGQSRLLSFNCEPLSLQGKFPLYPIAICYAISVFLSARDLINPFTTCFYRERMLNENLVNVMLSAHLFGLREVKQGYVLHPADPVAKGDSPKSRLTQRLLHFFLHSILYYLYVKHFVSEIFEKSEALPEDYLIAQLESDVNAICGILKLEKPEGLACLIRLIVEFAKKLPELQPGKDAQAEANRTAFEKQVAETVVAPMLVNIKEFSDQYTSELVAFWNSDYYATGSQLLREERTDPHYAYGEFFATLAVPTADGMIKCLAEETSKAQYPIACMLASVDEGVINRVRNLYTIVKVTNYFLEEYNYKLSEERAKVEQIRSANSEQLRGLVEELGRAWKDAKFRAEIDFDGRKVKNDINFESSSYVRDFLLDPKQSAGTLLIGGIKELAAAHNSIVSQFNRQMDLVLSSDMTTTTGKTSIIMSADESSKSIVVIDCEDQKALPVQSITSEDMVSFTSTYADLARTFYFHPAKDQKRVLYYDLEAVENWLMPKLIDKKILDAGRLETIHYQGTVHNDVPLLERLRRKKFDVPLEQCEVQEVTSFADSLSRDRQYDRVKAILSNLQCVMYYVESFEADPRTSMSVKSFCEQRFGGRSTLMGFAGDCPILAKVELRKLVQLYESLELYWFDFLLELVPQKFTQSERPEDVAERIRIFVLDPPALPEDLVGELILATKRFIIRSLDDEFNENVELADCLFKDELWDPAFRSQLKGVEERFPREVLARDVVQVLESITRVQSDGRRRGTMSNRSSILSDHSVASRKPSEAPQDLSNFQ